LGAPSKRLREFVYREDNHKMSIKFLIDVFYIIYWLFLMFSQSMPLLTQATNEIIDKRKGKRYETPNLK
jgi:hypothetical protein